MLNAALSQVEALLDVAHMKQILSDHVFSGADVSSCRILHFRYKPGCTWIVSYALSLPGAEDERIVYVRACERRGSEARYTKSRVLGQDVWHIPDLNSVAWRFPSDRKLAGMPALCDRAALCSNVLPRVVEAAFGFGWNVKHWSHEIVHYLPERSCMVRLDASLYSSTEPGRESAATFYGKTYPDGQGAETYRYLSELWDSSAARRGGLGLAQPLLYQPGSTTMWQLGIEGATLNVRASDDLEAAATALSTLHHLQVSGLPPYLPTANRLDGTAGVISAAIPDHRDAITKVVRHLRAQSAHLENRPAATLHGDLHLKNFIVLRDRVALIDLDTLAAGDPLADVASFAAAVYSGGLADGVSEDESRRSVATFVEAYKRASGYHMPEFDLNWHIAAALVTERVLRAVTRMKPDSPAADTLLSFAWRFAEAVV